MRAKVVCKLSSTLLPNCHFSAFSCVSLTPCRDSQVTKNGGEDRMRHILREAVSPWEWDFACDMPYATVPEQRPNDPHHHLLVVLATALLLKDRAGNAVQIPLTILADSATATGVLLEDTDLLEALEDFALDRACVYIEMSL
jgi:hypothetical protein